MSSYRLTPSFNSLTVTSKSSVPKATNSHRLLDVEPHRLSVGNTMSKNVSGVSNHQRRTSIVNHHHQRRNSQLRKASFTTSTLVCI